MKLNKLFPGCFAVLAVMTLLVFTSGAGAVTPSGTLVAQYQQEQPQQQAEPNKQERQQSAEPSKATEPSKTETESTAKEETQKTESEELPKTASYLPLAGMAGMLSFGAAAALRLARKIKG